jgi:hypothetical protein
MEVRYALFYIISVRVEVAVVQHHFDVVGTDLQNAYPKHQPALGPRGGLWPVLLMCNS